jgi:hypothetical protein
MGVEKYDNGFVINLKDFFNFGAVVVFSCLMASIFYYKYIAILEFRAITKTKNRFKKIMDCSEESIIIIKENKIDYMNDKFIEQQKNLIESAIIDNFRFISS